MKEMFVKPVDPGTKNFFTLYGAAWILHKAYLKPCGVRKEQQTAAAIAAQAVVLSYKDTSISKFSEEIAECIFFDVLQSREKETEGCAQEKLLNLYKDMYADIFKHHRKWCDMENTDEDWRLLIEQSSALVEKYQESPAGAYARNLVMTVLEEIERTVKLRETCL